MHGNVRGATVAIKKAEVTRAVMTFAGRRPDSVLDHHGIGSEIDLRHVPEEGTELYWASALAQIDANLAKVHAAAREGAHLSIFAFALVPLLVAFGNRLDDTLDADVYEARHASSGRWVWDKDAEPIGFEATLPPNLSRAEEAVLIVNASGTVDENAVPADIAHLPRLHVRPVDGHVPGQSTFEAAETLASFKAALHDMFERLELPANRSVGRLHVFAAVPTSAAVQLGRSLPVDNAAPKLALYHQTEGTYVHVFDIPRHGGMNR
jgi:hypothetical protein